MASVDLSLDDIIQKRYSRSFNRGSGGGARRGQQRRLDSRARGQNQNNAANKRSSVQGRGSGVKSGVSDARLRIIQNSRQKITDAREKLVQMAKQTDARVKLEKIRERRMEAMASMRLPRSVNASITRRTGRNGQISLTTGRKSTTPTIRRTVTNDLSTLPPPPLFGPPIQRNMYTWVNPVAQDSLSPTSSLDDLNLRSTLAQDHASLRRSPVQPTNIKVVARNMTSQKHTRTLASDTDWNYDTHSSRRGRIEVLDSDEEMNAAAWPRSGASSAQIVGRMSSELKARLDSPSVVPRSMGILSTSSNSTTTSTPTGHRIVVSNLQTSVTHEDIRELFEDIGPLMTSRLVRPGTAEVVYENHKDAVKAVDVYHNRQLDGQPMKCMLVNSRPPTTSSAGRGVNSGSSFKLPSGGKSSVVPDVGTIHKALFNKS